MQNRYVADIGDYAKYALLRRLCRSDQSRSIHLAVVWCLFPDETFNNDGKHISYLKDHKFAGLDPDLYEALNSIVLTNRRHISSIAEIGCLPASTVFCAEPVLRDRRVGLAERIRYRNVWLQECLQKTHGCELIFFDPDNGLETQSIPKHHPKAGKYIFCARVNPFLAAWTRLTDLPPRKSHYFRRGTNSDN